MITNENIIPLREGIFRDTPEGGVLVGQKCSSCGHIQFPANRLCLACLSEATEPVDLSAEGKLFCETTVHMKTSHFNPPYSVGYVALPEGIKVFAPLRAVEGLPFEVGMRMRVELVPMWDEAGQSVVAYRFYPV